MIKKKSKDEGIRYPFKPLFSSHFIWVGWFMLFIGVIYTIVYLLKAKNIGYLILGFFISLFLIIGGILIIRANIKKNKLSKN